MPRIENKITMGTLRLGNTVGLQISNTLPVAGDTWSGIVTIDLATGVAATLVGNASTVNPYVNPGASGLSNASTTVSFSQSTGNFDAGSIRVYGVR